jgi:hypothetical protein
MATTLRLKATPSNICQEQVHMYICTVHILVFELFRSIAVCEELALFGVPFGPRMGNGLLDRPQHRHCWAFREISLASTTAQSDLINEMGNCKPDLIQRVRGAKRLRRQYLKSCLQIAGSE